MIIGRTDNSQTPNAILTILSVCLSPRRCVHILLDICRHLSTHDSCVFVWCLNLGSHLEMTNQLVISKWGPRLKHQTNAQRLHGPLLDHRWPLRQHLLHVKNIPFVNWIQEQVEVFPCVVFRFQRSSNWVEFCTHSSVC